MGLLGPETSDRSALDIPLDVAETLFTDKKALSLTLSEMQKFPDANQVQVTKIERAGIPIPVGKDTKLQRMDVVTLVDLKDAVTRAGAFCLSKLLGYDVGTAAGLLAGAFSESTVIGTAGEAIQRLDLPASEKKALINSIPVA